MKRLTWELHYDPGVTAAVYALRGTQAGPKVHEAIKALQFVADPTENCTPIPERPGYYFFEVENHNVFIEVLEGDRKVIIILRIRPIA